jgi:hypothetical protein
LSDYGIYGYVNSVRIDFAVELKETARNLRFSHPYASSGKFQEFKNFTPCYLAVWKKRKMGDSGVARGSLTKGPSAWGPIDEIVKTAIFASG